LIFGKGLSKSFEVGVFGVSVPCIGASCVGTAILGAAEPIHDRAADALGRFLAGRVGVEPRLELPELGLDLDAGVGLRPLGNLRLRDGVEGTVY
jgi:hypothetical protein